MSTTPFPLPAEMDVPALIPARMLNEFAYCPRLAYLEWVQGEFADNLEVLEGRFGHRRVDDSAPTEVPQPLPADQPLLPAHQSPPLTLESRFHDNLSSGAEKVAQIHSRSVLLSAPQEGLIARIDVLDLQNSVAVPIDYKRGRMPDIPGGAWEPERVQLCAQGLILRENGYQCEGGILYYIESRRRISIPFDKALIDRTRTLAQQLREMAARRILPPPLDDSPKCPRCSLVGICLPDETRLLALAPPLPGAEQSAQREVRRLVPARDDALPLYIQQQGATLGKSGDQLSVKSSQQGTCQTFRLKDVSQVCLFGNVQLTAQALRELAAAGIPVCHFSSGGWFYALTTGMSHKNIELRIAQFATAADPQRSLALARQFVIGKIRNCRTLLRRNLPHSQDSPPPPQTATTEQRREVLGQLAHLLRRAKAADNAATLLGIEGLAAKTYFLGFANLLDGSVPFHIEARNRRPPRDPVNALLSFLYAILVKEWTLTVQAVGFDPMLGFYHRPRYGRPSLALDLAEEFRPLLADSTVLSLINNREVTAESFVRRAGAVALTDAGRRTVLKAFERRMDTLVTHPLFGYRISYRRILEVQARLLARVLLGEIPVYPNFCTR